MCLHLRVSESAIVILSTCSHVLSVLLIITTTSVRLTRGKGDFLSCLLAFLLSSKNVLHGLYVLSSCEEYPEAINSLWSPQIIKWVP